MFLFVCFVRQEEEFNWLLKEEVHAVLKQLQDVLKVKARGPTLAAGRPLHSIPSLRDWTWRVNQFDLLGSNPPSGISLIKSCGALRIWLCATRQQMTSPVCHHPFQKKKKCCCAISCVWCLRIGNNDKKNKHGLSFFEKNVIIESVPVQNYYIFFI